MSKSKPVVIEVSKKDSQLTKLNEFRRNAQSMGVNPEQVAYRLNKSEAVELALEILKENMLTTPQAREWREAVQAGIGHRVIHKSAMHGLLLIVDGEY